MDDDAGLIGRFRAGDSGAFEELVKKYQKPIYAMLYRMVGEHEDASDILQNTFVRAFTGLDAFEGRSTFKVWLYRIAVNLAKNLYRERAKATHVSIDDVVVHENPRVVERLAENKRRALLGQALLGLPEKQRLTLVLRVRDGLAFSEIAGVLECSIGAAKANYHHAVKGLKGLIPDKYRDGD